MIVIVSWAIVSGQVYDCDYDKLLIISTGWFVIMILVSWAIEK